MADNQREGECPPKHQVNHEVPQTSASQTTHCGIPSSSVSFHQPSTPFSRSQEPWGVLWYQQYYYQLCSYMYYWQAVASQQFYQRTFQSPSSYSQSGSLSSGSQAAYSGQQLWQNTTNDNRQPQPNNGVGLLPGIAVPWAFPGRQPVTTVCEVVIAPISKRVYAELLDFIFLYFTKVLVFSIFYDDLDRYNQLQYILLTDDAASLKVIEELLVQALVYRLMVFAYEVLFLMGGLHGSIGGATPGKYLMGISAVATDHITTVATDPDGERVRIIPGGNLGFWRSFLRALVKNFSMTFLFPVFLTILFFQHHRTIYDVIANSTVVVTVAAQPRQQGNQHHQQ